MTNQEFATMALSFEGTEENPHFERRSFKVIGKRIFATLHEASKTANLKLSPVDQSVFSEYDKGGIYPTTNKWGVQVWTTFELNNIPKSLMRDALNAAYEEVRVKKKSR